jgi:hypothetical protein
MQASSISIIFCEILISGLDETNCTMTQKSNFRFKTFMYIVKYYSSLLLLVMVNGRRKKQ